MSEAQRDPALRDIFNHALLSTPDGMPMVWMGRLLGHGTIRRVYGPDLVLNLCDHGRSFGFSHFFLGGNPGVAEDFAANLHGRFPGLKVQTSAALDDGPGVGMVLSTFSGTGPALATLPYLQPTVRGTRDRAAPGFTPGTLTSKEFYAFANSRATSRAAPAMK